MSLPPLLRGRRIWVVGCGFLGARLLAACREAGAACIGLDLGAAAADVRGDAALPTVRAEACRLLEPELIICAAATHGGDEAAYRRSYLELPRSLQQAFPAARLLFCSSSSVYGGQGGEVVTELSPCCPRTPTARVLAEAERLVPGMGAQHAVARLVPMYAGERCELLRRHLCREDELPGEDARWLNYVHREDAVSALLLLAGRLLAGQAPPCVNVAADSFRKGDVYEQLAALTALPRVGRVRGGGRRATLNQRVDAALLRSLGWQPQYAFGDWVANQLESRRGLC